MIDWLCTKDRALEHAVEHARTLSQQERKPVRVVLGYADGSVEEEFEVDAQSSSSPLP